MVSTAHVCAKQMLEQAGVADGSFVIRQTRSNPRGYVITAVSGGAFSNSQLKFDDADGVLRYGPNPLGGTLAEAVAALQTDAMVRGSAGAAYQLTLSVTEPPPPPPGGEGGDGSTRCALQGY